MNVCASWQATLQRLTTPCGHVLTTSECASTATTAKVPLRNIDGPKTTSKPYLPQHAQC